VGVFVPNRRFDPDDPEIMDREGNDPAILAAGLEELRRINRQFGGWRAVRRAIRPLVDRVDPGRTIEILDLGTGSADYPVHLAGSMRHLGRAVRIEAVDKNPFMVSTARGRAAAWPEIAVKEMDALSPAYADESFDIVLASLTLHHFSRPDAIRILREMNRMSRVGFVVNDLDRSRIGAAGVWLYAHFFTTNRVTRHDAYVSMLRGFTKNELIVMSGEAGIGSFVVKRALFFRLVLVGVHR
jgi:2-polyprenyl-3-methyl-5-hydroxy-6-metoxy-1,4-benzoquinol methylase